MENAKHAYLIIAHRNDENFKTLLKMLDHSDNDIFIHFDRKNKEYRPEETVAFLQKSGVFHTKRTDVRWGSFSQINAELLLLRLATGTGHYRYYHLLSGQDLPIKTQDEIHRMLADSDREYVDIDSNGRSWEYRVRYYQFWSAKLSIRENEERRKKIQEKEDRLHIRRGKNILFMKGANWFSITDDFARYVVSKELWIRCHFCMTICADEVFLQTVLWNSPFRSRLNDASESGTPTANCREIDWSRCNGMNPHVYTIEDLEMLKNSNAFFARKFDCGTDRDIVRKVAQIWG